MEPAIRVEGLGKRYHIGVDQTDYGTLRESIMSVVSRPLRTLRGRGAGASTEDLWALRDATFDVARGEVVGVVGRNGAGKTTLLKLLTRITAPTEGTAQLLGRVGALLEVGTGFHPELTGRENIYLNGAILGMRRPDIAARFDEIVEFSGLERFLDTPVKRYSSGMALRLGFSVAAHLEPEILLVDEVLAVGDAEFRAKTATKMEDVSKAGRTVLFVSHDMTAIQGLCPRAILLDGGRIVADGDTRDVLSKYSSMLSTTARTRIADRDDRRGSGALRFTDAWLENAAGTPVASIPSGEDVVIVTAYEAEANELKDAIFSFTIDSEFDRNIAVLWSELTGDRFASLPKRGAIACRVPRIPLAAGRYRIGLFARTQGLIADWIGAAINIEVTEGDFFGVGRQSPPSHSPVLVDQSWSARDEAKVSVLA